MPVKLATMLTAETVRAQVGVTSWEEAARVAGELLLAAGRVEPRYVEAMINVLREMGPYAVIAPGIVLLHARPEDGVLSPCLALVTLSTPVAFGHSENDPVDLVVALGAVDKQAHVSALQELALLLGDEAALQRMRDAQSDHELLLAVQSPESGS